MPSAAQPWMASRPALMRSTPSLACVHPMFSPACGFSSYELCTYLLGHLPLTRGSVHRWCIASELHCGTWRGLSPHTRLMSYA